MKVLLVGPYPPPHGGISVHVAEARKQLEQEGISCRILNLDRKAPQSDEYIRSRSGFGLALELLRHARRGWTVHLHTNGHNAKSWVLALCCGVLGQWAPASVLTLHSGMAPAYLNTGWFWRRALARVACFFFDRIISVNRQIKDAVITLGVPHEFLEELPAYVAVRPRTVSLDRSPIVEGSGPLLTTVLFFRPEYGFGLLVRALAQLRFRYPKLRCIVMGSGEQKQEAERLIREQDLRETVKLIGDVSHDECLSWMSVSDVFVRPTLEDGDSISVREALALGVPAVVSNVGARPPGARLFQAGDVEDLINQLEGVLAMPRDSRNAEWECSTWNIVHPLVEIYKQAAVPVSLPGTPV